MTRLLAISSVRIGLYIAASGGVSYLVSSGLASLTLAAVGILIFVLGVVGSRLPYAHYLPYAFILLAVGAVTLGLGGLPAVAASLGGAASDSVLGPVMRLVAAALGGLLFAVALHTLRISEEA